MLYGIVFFSQNTALLFNIARWLLILKRRDILFDESREDYLKLTNALASKTLLGAMVVNLIVIACFYTFLPFFPKMSILIHRIVQALVINSILAVSYIIIYRKTVSFMPNDQRFVALNRDILIFICFIV